MGLHKNLGVADLHGIVNFTYANQTFREADLVNLSAADASKVAHQTDDDSFWILKSDVTWVPLGGGGGSTGTIIARVATTADHGLSGLADIDGVTPFDGDYIVVKSQSNTDENGLWIADASTWSRAPEMAAGSPARPGFIVSTGNEGADTNGTVWYLDSGFGATIGSSAMAWTQIAGRRASGGTIDTQATGTAGTSTEWSPADHRHGIADAAVTRAKLSDGTALSVIGRSANSTGVPADISTSAASAAVLRESGSTIGFGTVATAGIANDAITDTKLRNSGALSVIGRSANSSGDPADISAVAAAGSVLRESGSTIGFGTIATAGITDAAVTRAKLSDGTALSVIGRSANSSGVPADIAASAASGAVLRESGSTIGFGTIATAGIAANAVTDAKLRQGTARTVIGRSANSTGDVADIAGTGAASFLRDSGTALAFSTLVLADLPSSIVLDRIIIPSFATDDPNGSNWAVNAIATLSADSANAALVNASFDDTTEEGRGWEFTVPTGCTSFRLITIARCQSAPAGTRTVGTKLYKRLIAAVAGGSAVSSWESVTLSDFSFTTNTNFLTFSRTILLTDYTTDMLAGETYQFEFTRVNPAGGTEVTGDVNVKLWVVEFI